MITTRENGSLYTKIENKIATIEFGHPASNSFPSELLERLRMEFEKLSEDESVQVIILKSEGEKAFCAGASFDELMAIENMQQGKLFFSGFANVINAMRDCKKLIVGRIQGKTVGGGVGLAAACDYIMATEAAAIKLSELSIGIGPFVIAPAVERKIGVSALAELTLRHTNGEMPIGLRKKACIPVYSKLLKTWIRKCLFFQKNWPLIIRKHYWK